MLAARVTGHRVEDTSQESEYGHTYANPDGTWTSDDYAGPVQVQDAQGAWQPIDPNLTTTSNGDIKPAVSAADVVFGGGGSTTLARMTVDGKPVTWTWPSALPIPTVSGTSATYHLDDTENLVLTATSNGFSQDIVLLKQPSSVWQMPTPTISGAAGAVTSNSSMTFATPAGKTLVTSSAPYAFDSSRNAGGDPAVSPLAATLTPITTTKQKLSLNPVASFLSAKSTVYPVTIDPSYTGTPADTSADTWVQTPGYTASQYTSPELKVGTYDGGTDVARTFLKFGGAPWTSRHILSAQLRLRNWYSSSCTGDAVRVARVTDSWGQTTIAWGNQPNWTTTNHSDLTTAHGYNASTCGAADAVWDITGMVQDWSAGAEQDGVVIKGLDEKDSLTWRRYRSTEYGSADLLPRITYTYNTVPNTPSAPTVSTSPASNAGYVTSVTPTLTAAKLTDPDGGTLQANFTVYSGTTAVYTSGLTAAKASGSAFSVTVPAGKLVNGTTYTARVTASDGTDTSAASAASAAFTVDTSKPATAITATGFANGQWVATPPASNTFTLTGPSDTKTFLYQLDGGTWTTISATSAKATFSWLPTSSGHEVDAYAIDAAGNRGPTAAFTFGVGNAASFATPGVGATSTGTFPLSLSGPAGASSAGFSWRYAGKTTWNPISQVNTASGSAWSNTSMATTSGESLTPSLLWNATSETDPASSTGATLTAPALVEIQGCFTYPGTSVQSCTAPRQVQLVPSAFGGNYPTTSVGPAQVALYTGEMSLSESDAVDQQAGVGRSFSTFGSATMTSGVFGSGWSSSIDASSDATMQLIDHRSQDRTFVLVGAGDASQIFTPLNASDNVTSPSAAVKFVPAGTNDGSVLTMSKDQNTVTLVRQQGDTTTWTYQVGDGETTGSWQLQSGASPSGAVNTVTQDATFSFIAETAPGDSATCTPAVQDPGCRALKILYTGTGDAKRVSEVDLIRAGQPALPVATYTYATVGNVAGLLTKVCGPDPDKTSSSDGPLTPLCSSYTYDTTSVSWGTLLKTMTPPGQAAWTFNYDSTGRLVSITRPLDPTTGTGNATWSINYGLSLTGGGMPDLSAATVAGWGESDAPTKVFAVTAPSGQGNGVHGASLFYTNALGNTVNTASYGNVTSGGAASSQWLISTSWYDATGNLIRSLDPDGLGAALASPADEVTVASEHSSIVVYNPAITYTIGGQSATIAAGTRVTDEYGPEHLITRADGTTIEERVHTAYTYDDQAPSLGGGGKPAYTVDEPTFNLVVQTDTNAVSATDMSALGNAKSTRNTYGPLVSGDGNGWTFGTPSQTSVLSNGTYVVTSTGRLNADGAQIETRQPGGATDATGAGNDAHATVMSYYADTSSDPDCQINGHADRAGWEGLACKTRPAAQPTGTVSNTMPTTWTQSYDANLQPLVVTETSGSTTRTTTTVYDSLERPTSVTINDGHDKRVQTISYDAATGQEATVSGTGSSTDTGSAISSLYDSWGRVKSYSDAGGDVTTTTYTVDGAPAQVADVNGHTAYAYANGALSSMNTTAGAGSVTFTVGYDADGNTATVNYGSALSAIYGYDEAGIPTSIAYADASGNPIASFSNTVDVYGTVVAAGSTGSAQTYAYDALGRLTSVQDTRNGSCTSRVYGFDATSDRTSLNIYGPASDGSCQTSTSSSARTWSYDQANRITSTGYTYDNLGRTLTVSKIDTNAAGDPGASALAVGYYANDMAASLTQTVTNASGAAEVDKDAYGLDGSGRIDHITSTANGSEVRAQTYEFGDDSDAPTAIATHTDAVGSTAASNATTRYITLGGLGMVASADASGITYQLQNLHGDTVTTATAAGVIGSLSETDEYGNAASASTGSHATSYGYLGGAQRGSGSTGGVILMGARLYDPVTGSFLSLDPVLGGNATAYGYPVDPIDELDVSGLAKTPSVIQRSLTSHAAPGILDMRIICDGLGGNCSLQWAYRITNPQILSSYGVSLEAEFTVDGRVVGAYEREDYSPYYVFHGSLFRGDIANPYRAKILHIKKTRYIYLHVGSEIDFSLEGNFYNSQGIGYFFHVVKWTT